MDDEPKSSDTTAEVGRDLLEEDDALNALAGQFSFFDWAADTFTTMAKHLRLAVDISSMSPPELSKVDDALKHLEGLIATDCRTDAAQIAKRCVDESLVTPLICILRGSDDAGTTEQTNQITRLGGIPPLLELLRSQSLSIRRQATFAIHNLAANSPEDRREIGSSGFAPLMASIRMYMHHFNSDIAVLASQTLRLLCTSQDLPMQEYIVLIRFFTSLIEQAASRVAFEHFEWDPVILRDALACLYTILTTRRDGLDIATDNGSISDILFSVHTVENAITLMAKIPDESTLRNSIAYVWALLQHDRLPKGSLDQARYKTVLDGVILRIYRRPALLSDGSVVCFMSRLIAFMFTLCAFRTDASSKSLAIHFMGLHARPNGLLNQETLAHFDLQISMFGLAMVDEEAVTDEIGFKDSPCLAALYLWSYASWDISQEFSLISAQSLLSIIAVVVSGPTFDERQIEPMFTKLMTSDCGVELLFDLAKRASVAETFALEMLVKLEADLMDESDIGPHEVITRCMLAKRPFERSQTASILISILEHLIATFQKNEDGACELFCATLHRFGAPRKLLNIIIASPLSDRDRRRCDQLLLHIVSDVVSGGDN